MSGKIKGAVYKITEEKGDKKDGGQWVKKTLVINTHTEYNNLAPIVFFGKNIDKITCKENEEVEVIYFLGGREYNGKFYADVSGQSVTVVGNKQPTAPDPIIPEATNGDDDLPF